MQSTTADSKTVDSTIPVGKDNQPISNETKAKTTTREIAEAPVEAGHAVVQGVEVVGHEVAKVVVAAVTAIEDATKKAVNDIEEAGKKLRREPLVVSPASETLRPNMPPVTVVTPVVTLPMDPLAPAVVAPVE
jgi:hypothetical protein